MPSLRPIHLADMDQRRPVLILTRELVRPRLRWITVAPITARVRGLSTEVAVGPRNGLERESVVTLDNVATLRADELGPSVGFLLTDQEPELAAAIIAAFDLQV